MTVQRIALLAAVLTAAGCAGRGSVGASNQPAANRERISPWSYLEDHASDGQTRAVLVECTPDPEAPRRYFNAYFLVIGDEVVRGLNQGQVSRVRIRNPDLMAALAVPDSFLEFYNGRTLGPEFHMDSVLWDVTFRRGGREFNFTYRSPFSHNAPFDPAEEFIGVILPFMDAEGTHAKTPAPVD